MGGWIVQVSLYIQTSCWMHGNRFLRVIKLVILMAGFSKEFRVHNEMESCENMMPYVQTKSIADTTKV